MSLWSRIERRLGKLADRAGDIIIDEYREEVLAARDLLEKGEADRAAGALEALLDARRDHVGALTLLGAARLELGEAEAAEKAFGRARELRPDSAESWIGLGEALLALERDAEAIAAFRGAVKIADGDRGVLALGYRGLGIGYRRGGELDKAIRELRKAVAEDPADPVARGYLGEALLADQRISAGEARRHLARAVESERPPAVAHIALGQIALADGLVSEARAAFEKGLGLARGERGRRHEVAALLGLGDAALADDQPDEANRCYLQALELAPRDAAVHARIGEVHRRVGNPDEAIVSYDRALALGAHAEILHRALDTAIEADALDAAVRLANDVLAGDPADPAALVARGLAMARSGQYEAARATLEIAARHDAPRAHLALGRLELDSDPTRAAGARAASRALAALRVAPRDQRARQLLADARARELGEPDADSDADGAMYRLAGDLQRLALARRELSGLAGEAAQAMSDFDRPLLVTVMGEFSSGKSTFVNAFIGADVAPTGITPTTATINIVKYGRERGGRILRKDGSIESLGWDQLFGALRALEAADARAIELVEILLPLPALERVNIVDTPGLNSILPEHEEVARGFIARADAVVWLFTAGQGGKASEREALEKIQAEGKRVLAVLNKKDQLRAAEVDEVVRYVNDSLGGLVELVVPLSARAALAHRRPRDEGAAPGPPQAAAPESPAPDPATDSGWRALDEALEARFFTRARELKRDACSRRLAGMLGRARRIVGAERDTAQNAAEALAAAATATDEARIRFIDDVVIAQRAAITDEVVELYRRASRETLELVRPRSLPFGSHQATRADRDYLVSILDSGYEAALVRSRREVARILRTTSETAVEAMALRAGVVGADAIGDVQRTADDAAALVAARVFDRCRAFLRGYLEGGFVDTFFRRDLPKIELSEDAIYHALYRDAPNLDDEIALPLAEAGATALGGVAERVRHWAEVAEVLAYDLEVGVGRALEGIDERRARLVNDR